MTPQVSYSSSLPSFSHATPTLDFLIRSSVSLSHTREHPRRNNTVSHAQYTPVRVKKKKIKWENVYIYIDLSAEKTVIPTPTITVWVLLSYPDQPVASLTNELRHPHLMGRCYRCIWLHIWGWHIQMRVLVFTHTHVCTLRKKIKSVGKFEAQERRGKSIFYTTTTTTNSILLAPVY